MQKKLTLLCLSFFCYFTCVNAQTYKGLWMVNGKLETNTLILNGKPSTALHLQPQVAVNFSDNWMAGASLSIDVANKVARVGHGLFIRHTIIKANKNEFFTHLFFEHSTQRSLLAGGGRNKITTTKIGPGLGLLHFFNKAIAMEIKMDYEVFQKLTNQGFEIKQNGNFIIHTGLQFFFDSKLKADSTKWNYEINKGDWVIGGFATIGKANLNEFSYYTSNLLQPFAGYFITNRILVGTGFNYNNDNTFRRFVVGLSPFGRYYIKAGRKHQFFGEFKFAYNAIWSLIGDQYDRSHLSYIISPGLGYSTWILPEVSFDIKFNMDRNASFLDKSQWFKTTQFNFNVGLTAFLRN